MLDVYLSFAGLEGNRQDKTGREETGLGWKGRNRIRLEGQKQD